MNSARSVYELADREELHKGLAKLVLSLVDLLRELLERRALDRVGSGELSGQEVERLGLALKQIRETVREMGRRFGVKPEELMLDVMRDRYSQASLVDVLDKFIDRGAVVAGEVTFTLAGVDLIALNLLATLSSVRRCEIA